MPQIASNSEYGLDVQDAVTWRISCFLRNANDLSKALPAFTIPSGGGVHVIQLLYAGSADRGERRLNGAF